MDELPSVHWRTERNVGLEQRSPRLTISDVFVLTACSAAGMMVARLMLGESGRQGLGASVEVFVFAVIVPCLLGGLVIGHPVLMAIHSMAARRQGALSFGEGCGLVPGVSTFLLFAITWFFAEVDRGVGGDASFHVPIVLLIGGYALANLGVSILAIIYTVILFGNRDLATWTTCLGTAAALVPGGIAALWFIAALALA